MIVSIHVDKMILTHCLPILHFSNTAYEKSFDNHALCGDETASSLFEIETLW
jgi:hypothetical protein